MNDFEQPQPSSQPPPQPALPWEAPQRWLAGFYPTFWWIARYPSRTFSLPAAGGPLRPALFVAVLALHLELISQALAWALTPGVGLAELPSIIAVGLMNGMVQGVGAAMLATPILSGLAHLALRAVGRARAPYVASYRALAYTAVTSVSVLAVMIVWHLARLAWGAESGDSLVGVVMGGLACSLVWSLYVGGVALDAAHHCGKVTAMAAQVAAALAMILFMFGIFGVGGA
ncbi:hypothetical protein Deba_0429 [Desulfarculus baarsii DSM 2075]|uniref:Uncharacterized protein n=1 Tax=Desulfarculus baarsii (strain ATCC 33931 / DSM 2075 / LMG 7858 / VKM B-1802 / 2st14) TaxID=644282 RepID=E1QE17_DESB2|nr:YIP1 family protein [Desulfarculus baarsii]ADK83803.1 hypothetical protein Deba_0429 [Desulfarculus baarsii DSM 2075]